MKRAWRWLLAVAVAVSMIAPRVVAQAPRVAESERLYLQSLSKVWAAAWTLPIAADWCILKFPSTEAASTAALRTWHDEFAELIAELDKRIEVISRGSGNSIVQLEAKKEQLRRAAFMKFDNGMSNVTAVKQQEECERLPTDFSEKRFDLELNYASELEIIRSHPLDVDRPKSE